MPTGTVKWFNNAKGYGFILPDEGGEDLFAHYSAIQMDGYKTLKAGQLVAFDITQGQKGYHATNIISSDSPQADELNAKPEQVNGEHRDYESSARDNTARVTTH